MKAAACVESASAHAHAATTHVEAAATTVEAATAAAVSATTAPMSTATAAMAGGRRIGREGSNHGHARQKGEDKLVFHVTPSSCSALHAICIKGTRPQLKPSEGGSGFRARQLILREVALRHAEHRRGRQIEDAFLFAGAVDDRTRRRERGGNVAVAHDAAKCPATRKSHSSSKV
jgi:hypothetical protein